MNSPSSAVERVARAICKAQCVGNQTPDDLMGVLHIPAPEQTRPYRWELSVKAAQAALDTIQQGHWRSIESAPVNEVVLWWIDGLGEDGWIKTGMRQVSGAPLAIVDEDGSLYWPHENGGVPTHWMPLPPPPEALAVSTADQDQGQRDE